MIKQIAGDSEQLTFQDFKTLMLRDDFKAGGTATNIAQFTSALQK